MNVGLYFDLRNPPEWEVSPSRLYGFTLEVCEEADRLGCHSIWLSEHHLFEDGYLPQPLTFAAAVAARTREVRIGTAIMIGPLHHPVELAEQGAIVDILSDGRLEIGMGAGYRPAEFALFGADQSTRYAQNDDRARELRRLWSPGGVTPAPVQEHLPIWMGYQGPRGARRAGLLGEGLLSIDPELWPHYRDALGEGGYEPEAGRMAGAVQGWVSDDPERDWPVVAKHVSHQFDSYRRLMVAGTDLPVPRPVDPDKLKSRAPRGPLSYFAYETVEGMANWVVTHTAGAPVETVFLWASISGMPEDMVVAEVKLVCERLAPLLADFSAKDAP